MNIKAALCYASFYSRILIIYLLPILIIIYMISIPVLATTYYVNATAGLDNNNGITPSTAWKTISKVNSARLLAGDYVLFNRGRVWREGLMIPASGTGGNPITFGAYGQGVSPIINAADLVNNWTPYNGTTYKAPLTTATSRVFYAGVELTMASSPGTLGINTWIWAAGYLYVNIGKDPTDSSIEATQRNYAVQTKGKSNILLTNLHLIYNNSNSNGVLDFYPSGSMNFTVINNIIEYGTGDGIRAEVTGGNNLVISNNIVRYNKMWGISAGNRLSTGHSYTYNTVYQNGKSGFLIVVQNSEFSNNVIYGNPDYSRGDGKPNHGFYMYNYGNGDNGSTIEYNEVFGFNDPIDGDSALRLSGSNCIVRYNYFHDNDYGMYLIDAEISADSNYIYYNVFSGINENHYGIESEGATNSKIYNNTLVGSGIIFVNGANGNSHGNSVINNIIRVGTNSGSTLLVASGQQTGFLSNNNLFYPNNGNRFQWLGTNVNFANWVKISQADTNSIASDPLFVMATTIDQDRFSLTSGSPAISAGQFLQLTKDIDGTIVPNGVQPNIGSFQNNGS